MSAKTERNHNPYELKTHEEILNNYKEAEDFLKYLNKKGIEINRVDNLPRFASNNKILMIKKKRKGKFGSAPTCYKIPSDLKIEEIKKGMKNNNTSILGKKMLTKKKSMILEIFDKAEHGVETKTSIAKQVTKSLGISCDRKLVAAWLTKKRSSKLDKLNYKLD